MREIFRAKSTEGGEWVEGHYAEAIDTESGELKHIIITGVYIHSDGRMQVSDYVEVDPETLGQCTGMDDNNGVDIFEGDILQMITDVQDGKKRIYIVNWCEYSGMWSLSCVTDDKLDANFTNFWGFDFKIIGNIHDNPEMLGDANA